MPNKVIYEWSVETVDEFGDIEDSSFYDVIEEVPTLEDNQRLCLVRNEGNDDEGLTHRLGLMWLMVNYLNTFLIATIVRLAIKFL